MKAKTDPHRLFIPAKGKVETSSNIAPSKQMTTINDGVRTNEKGPMCHLFPDLSSLRVGDGRIDTTHIKENEKRFKE